MVFESVKCCHIFDPYKQLKTRHMKHLFMPYDLSLKAKQLKFNELCFGFYAGSSSTLPIEMMNCKNDEWGTKSKSICTAPIYQQIVDWLRENHKIDLSVSPELFTISQRLFSVEVDVCYEAKIYSHAKLIKRVAKKEYYQALNNSIGEAFKIIQ